jgi:hypothetical protein
LARVRERLAVKETFVKAVACNISLRRGRLAALNQGDETSNDYKLRLVDESDYSDDEVADSIRSLHAGLEFPDSRFVDFTLPGTAWHFILGTATKEKFDPRSLTDHPTSLIVNGTVATTGCGGDALDGPLNALVWITNTLSKLGVGLEAGQFVTTGVTGKPTPVNQGDSVSADLGKFGSVTASLCNLRIIIYCCLNSTANGSNY